MKILLIEDNEKLSSSLKKGLEQEGYVVDALIDGLAAERRILAHPQGFDLMVLDIMLPGMDGLTLCKVIRDSGITTPILMLTAKDTIEDKIGGLDSGADDYLIKPFSFEELLARIRALLRRQKETLGEKIEANGITLENMNKSVEVNGKEVSLTLREFSLLEYFMRHPNQTLSRKQIWEHAWEYSSDPISNVIDVHIKNLRKKLGEKHGAFLQTLRGMGYKFKV